MNDLIKLLGGVIALLISILLIGWVYVGVPLVIWSVVPGEWFVKLAAITIYLLVCKL